MMLPKTPTQLLLLDGMGALVTAAAMALLLVPLEGFFGLPAPTAYFLAALGALFACYSLFGAFRGASQSSTRLRNIAIANLGYSALSLVLMVHHRDVLTPFGYAYLGVEIALVTALANHELTVARLCAKL